jgi:hypothetical protein
VSEFDKIVDIDPAVPGGDSTSWGVANIENSECHPVTMEEIRYVFSQTIGYRVEFYQYSSHFIGTVQCITPDDVIVVTLCKDGSVVPTLHGRVPFYAVKEIMPQEKRLSIHPDFIVSMSKFRSYK